MNLIESQINLELTTVSHTTKDPVLPICQVSDDCWTRKSYKGSFYGETINFYNLDKQCVTQRTIAIDELHHQQTTEQTIEKYSSVHDSFGIRPVQIALILSDNASNMVKAFDLPDSELYTTPDPHDHDQLEDLDTDFEELSKE